MDTAKNSFRFIGKDNKVYEAYDFIDKNCNRCVICKSVVDNFEVCCIMNTELDEISVTKLKNEVDLAVNRTYAKRLINLIKDGEFDYSSYNGILIIKSNNPPYDAFELDLDKLTEDMINALKPEYND